MIETIIEDEEWRLLLPEAAELAAACHEAAAAREHVLLGEIALMLCDDAAMTELNHRFRSKNQPTNVLSFPSGEVEGFLGDIALARETCQREAAEKSVALRDHAAHLIIHGMLHLIGYDHQTDSDAAAMERRETQILADMNIANPYGDDERDDG